MSEAYHQKLEILLARYNLAKERVRSEEEFLTRAGERLENVLKAQSLVQQVAEHVQGRAHAQIAGVVTRCLKAVFGESAYEFKIKFSRKRGKTDAELLFIRDGHELAPLEASGGGVVDVTAFALRLACLVLSLPRKRRLLVLDEPFKHLSKHYRPRVRKLLETLAEELKTQIIMVTHSEELTCGKIITLE